MIQKIRVKAAMMKSMMLIDDGSPSLKYTPIENEKLRELKITNVTKSYFNKCWLTLWILEELGTMIETTYKIKATTN